MPTFKEQMAADMPVFFNTDEFAVDVLYDDGTGAVGITAIMNDGDGGTGRNADAATILVQKADVPNPQYRHTFTIDGELWQIDGEPGKGLGLEGDDFVHVIRIMKNERVSKWRK